MSPWIRTPTSFYFYSTLSHTPWIRAIPVDHRRALTSSNVPDFVINDHDITTDTSFSVETSDAVTNDHNDTVTIHTHTNKKHHKKSQLHIQSFTFNPYCENTYVLYDTSTSTCAIIDPGCYEPHEQTELMNFIKMKQLKVSHLINTHAHIDHILGNYCVKKTFDVPLTMHELEVPVLDAAGSYASQMGFTKYQHVEAETLLQTGDTICIGDIELSVLHVPGHSPGHIALINKDAKVCVSGDVLFKRGIGRTDMPGGDYVTLIQSIHQQMFPLGDGMMVYPGHGQVTTIGEEIRENPFCQEWLKLHGQS